MLYSIIRLTLRTLPLIYMAWIWLQSSYFNPESIVTLSYQLNQTVVYMIGAMLELFHLIEFGLLYLFLVIAFLTYGDFNKNRDIAALAIALLYGLIDEIHQYFVPFRSFSISDIVKDIIGVLVIWYIIDKNYFKRKDTKFGLVLRKISSVKGNKNIQL